MCILGPRQPVLYTEQRVRITDSREWSRVVVQTEIRASDRDCFCCFSVRADPANHSVAQTGSHLSRAKFPPKRLTAAPRLSLFFCEPRDNDDFRIKLIFGKWAQASYVRDDNNPNQISSGSDRNMLRLTRMHGKTLLYSSLHFILISWKSFEYNVILTVHFNDNLQRGWCKLVQIIGKKWILNKADLNKLDI